MRLTALALSAALLAPLTAVADDDSVPPVTDPLVKKETGEAESGRFDDQMIAIPTH